MSDNARRVVLLARPGPACERMRDALGQAGARIVLEADPTRLEQAELMAATPEVVLVVLDPVTEDVIDRFGGVLGDAAIEVIFEEAELAVSREGWDAARWVRHLSAKLHRHDDVLPPGREAEEPVLEPFVAAALSVSVGGESAGHASAAREAADHEPAVHEPAGYDFDPVAFEYAGKSAGDATNASAEPIAFAPLPGDPAEAASPASADRPAAPSAPVWSLDEPAPAAASPAVPPPLPWELEEAAPADANAPAANASATNVAVTGRFDGVGLALVDAVEASATADVVAFDAPDGDDSAATGRFERDLADLETRIESMGQVQPAAAAVAAPSGVVVVLAGIGGPDAVRQLLGALPGGFSRPVLVQQRLDGGRYDKLVAQMQRATVLPVRLAEVGQPLESGAIYIVPPNLGIADAAVGLVFDESGAGLLAAVPAADSAVLMLSGSDPALVDAAMNLSWAGALVAAQALDGCYDAAAPSELIARGASSGTPAELAQQLARRWLSLA